MKITVWTWKDEKWSASKKDLEAINKMVKKNETKIKRIKPNIGDKFFMAIGWIAISPFVLKELIIRAFKWLKRKIKRKN